MYSLEILWFFIKFIGMKARKWSVLLFSVVFGINLLLLLVYGWREMRALRGSIMQQNSIYEEEIRSLLSQVTSRDAAFLTVDKATNQNSPLVIYNRVPKTGSTTFANIAYKLAKRNKFHMLHINVTYKKKHRLNIHDQQRLVTNISLWTDKHPALYHDHLNFVDFNKFGFQSPIYINIVRDPIERFISYYYFLHSGDDYRPSLQRSESHDNKTLDECLRVKGKQCDFYRTLWIQIPFFCGQSVECLKPGRWALDQAKANLLKRYLVVGVTEHLEDFIALLEVMLPHYFSGAHHLYKNTELGYLRRTKAKVEPSEAALSYIRRSGVYKLEQEFYEFARSNFESQFNRTLVKDRSRGMHSPTEELSTGLSSATLPEYSNGWETSSTSDDTSSPSSRPSTLNELIGSPGMSPISHDTPSEDHDFDQDTVISLNENDTTVTEEPIGSENEHRVESSENRHRGSDWKRDVSSTVRKESTSSVTEPSCTESEALDAVAGKAELHHLKKSVKKLKNELDKEKDMVIQLRKRLTLTNKDKLSQTSEFNDEMLLLKCENVALQARLEEQTVYTEQLEYELAKVRKKQKQDKIFSDQREAQDTKEIEDLKSRSSETQSKLATLEENLSMSKRENAEEIHRLRVELEGKEGLIAKTSMETEIAKTENHKLTEFIKEQESTLKEMLEKIQTTESELTAASSELNKCTSDLTEQQTLTSQQLHKLQVQKEQYETVIAELEEQRSVGEQLRSTNDSLEAKSVQLECAVNGEKSTSGDLRTAMEQMRQKLHELEDKHCEQTRELSETMHSLTRSEQELSNLKTQLHMEKDDKKDLVGKLKKQLDLHQEHVKKLRADLAATNKHQKYMEEISQKIVNDLQPVFSGFPTEAGEMKSDSSGYSVKTATEDRTRNVFDTLYSTVARYKRRFTSLSEEKLKAKAMCDSLGKESASYKEMLYEKERAYDDCKGKLSDALREIDRVSRESTELEARCATMTVDVETAKSHNQTLQAQCQSLRQEILQLKGRYEREVDEKHLYLQHIHHLLTSDLDLCQGQLLGSGAKLSWSELSTTVTERLAAVLTELSNLRSQVYRLDETVRKGDSYIEGMREEYTGKIDDINSQLAASIERNSAQWKSERSQLEEHYSNMISENQNRQQKSQRNAEEAWDKLRYSDETNRDLEAEKLEIHEKITLLEQRQRSLLCALALIAGCYFPLLNRHRDLKEQRSMLMQQVERFGVFKTQIESLLHSLVPDETPGLAGNSTRPACVRLKFRKVGLVVLAAGRLQKLGRRAVLCVRDEDRSTSLCWTTTDCAAIARTSDPATEGWLVQWLCHVDLESISTLCTKDILEAMEKPSDSSAFTKRGYLQSVVSSSLTKLIRQLSVLYTMDDAPAWSTRSYSTNSLSIRLLNGLNRTMSKVSINDQLPVGAARSLATQLQEKVLSFVQQLHASETERKRLKHSVDTLTGATDQLRQYQDACSDLESELHNTRNQVKKLVSADELNDVMAQLEVALEREKEAQALLAEQGSQLKQLTHRLESELADRNHSEQSAKFALKALNDELDNKVGLINNLSRQLSSHEGERQSIHDNLYDAEQALKSAAQDRQTLSNYVDTLVRAFTRCSSEGSNADLSRVMLSGELIPSGRGAPDLLSVQKLAQKFVESYTALQAKISALNTVTTEQLQEITKLKQEMSLVCTGQTQQNHSQVYQYPSSGYGSSLSPLKVSSDYSPVRRSPAVLDMGLMKRTAPLSPHRLSSSRGSQSPRLELSGNIRR